MGVKRAIDLALEASRRYRQPIKTIGPLIHNPHVLEMLKKKGIHEIEDRASIDKGIILIRAHGIPPDDRLQLQNTGSILIDATCPRVQRIHSQIKKHLSKGYWIVVFGDPNHAEVVGLLGTAAERGILVSSPDDVESLPDISSPVLLVAQTTQSRDSFNHISKLLEQKYNDLLIIDTLCATTEQRQEEVIKLANEHDVVIVVGGKNSANTARLAELARNNGTLAYHIENEEDLPTSLPDDISSIAVTAGASTPNWMIERVIDKLEAIKIPRTMRNYYVEGIKWLTESFVLIVLGSAALTLTGSFYLSHSLELIPIIVAAAYVFSMHILNHFADKQSVAINEPLREEVFQRHQIIFIILGTLSGLLSLGLSFFLEKLAFIIVSVAVVTGAVYSFRIVPRSMIRITRYQRLKEIPASKDIVVAFAWSAVTVFVPFLRQSWNQERMPQLMLVWFIIFLFVYIRSVLLDIKDIQGDRIVGKETLPIILGERKAISFIRYLLIIEAGLIIIGSISGLLPAFAFFHILSLAPILMVIIWYRRGRLRRRYHFQAILDISFISFGIITLIAIMLR